MCEEIFATYAVQQNIDILHKVVTDGRARKQAIASGKAVEDRKDLWKEDLQPRNVVRARTIPLLEKESERLKKELAKVRISVRFASLAVIALIRFVLSSIQMEMDNLKLEKQLQATVKERKEADRVCEEIFAFLEDVRSSSCLAFILVHVLIALVSRRSNLCVSSRLKTSGVNSP